MTWNTSSASSTFTTWIDTTSNTSVYPATVTINGPVPPPVKRSAVEQMTADVDAVCAMARAA